MLGVSLRLTFLGNFNKNSSEASKKTGRWEKALFGLSSFYYYYFFFNSAQSLRRVPTTSAPIPLQHRPCPHAVSPPSPCGVTPRAPGSRPHPNLRARGHGVPPASPPPEGDRGVKIQPRHPPTAWGCSLGTQPGCGDMGTVALMPPGPAGRGLSVPSSPGRGGGDRSRHPRVGGVTRGTATRTHH